MIWLGIHSFRPGAIEALGFSFLLATPVGLVLLVGWNYWRGKEYPLFGFSCLALGILAWGFLLGVRP